MLWLLCSQPVISSWQVKGSLNFTIATYLLPLLKVNTQQKIANGFAVWAQSSDSDGNTDGWQWQQLALCGLLFLAQAQIWQRWDAARGFIQRPWKAAGSFPLFLTRFVSRLKGRGFQSFLSIQFLKEKNLSLAKKVLFLGQFAKWADFSKIQVPPEDGFFQDNLWLYILSAGDKKGKKRLNLICKESRES